MRWSMELSIAIVVKVVRNLDVRNLDDNKFRWKTDSAIVENRRQCDGNRETWCPAKLSIAKTNKKNPRTKRNRYWKTRLLRNREPVPKKTKVKKKTRTRKIKKPNTFEYQNNEGKLAEGMRPTTARTTDSAPKNEKKTNKQNKREPRRVESENEETSANQKVRSENTLSHLSDRGWTDWKAPFTPTTDSPSRAKFEFTALGRPVSVGLVSAAFRSSFADRSPYTNATVSLSANRANEKTKPSRKDFQCSMKK